MVARDRLDDGGAYVQPSQQTRAVAWLSPSCETNCATSAASEGDAVPSDVNGSDPRARDLVRVAVVDDHAAIRIGVTSALASQPGLVCVGVAADGEELQPLLHRTRPHVVVLDYHLPRVSGLELCRRIKSDALAPAVLLYSAYADPALRVPARVAGADGIVHKSSPARELFEAIHVVAGGGTHMPPLIPELLEAARAALDAQDRRVLDLLVEWTPRWEIAAALGVPIPEIDERTSGILARLGSGMARPGSVEP
jgi:DNA-binding NarL/FixJ family response regulator